MRVIKKSDLIVEGIIPYAPAPNPRRPFDTAIYCRYPMINFRLMEVPPWGLVLPVLGAKEESIEYNFEAETLYMPAGTVLGIRWSPHDGQNIHTLTRTLPGDGQVSTFIPIPDAWVLECEGQGVLIEYEASYPDGSVDLGRSFDVQVSKHLDYGEVSFDGLEDGDTLNPSDYPDGIGVTIEPVVNVAEYNTIRFFWHTYGHLGDTLVLLSSWLHVINCAPGKTYQFVVPAESYSEWNDPRFDYVSAIATCSMILLPEPQMQMRWGFGAKTFGIAYETKSR